MDDALAQWLALREPHDASSRSEPLTRLIGDRLSGREPLRILDLATGAGANIRFLVPRLPARRQQWLAVDRSEMLLASVTSRPPVAVEGTRHVIQTRFVDLATLDPQLFSGRDLVTASAL